MVTFYKRFFWVLFFLTTVSPSCLFGEGLNRENIGVKILIPDDGDFAPDTVNVFRIAKDVSGIFSDAINSDVYHDIKGDTAKLNTIFNSNYASNDIGRAYQDAVEEEIKAKKGDFGLNLRGDYTENFTPGLSVEEDLTFKRRFYVGLEWDIIKGGLFDAGNKIHQLKMESILKEYESLEYVEKENYRYLFNYVNYVFNVKKIELLSERKELVKKQLNFTKELYHLRYIGWEDVLKYQAKLEDIDHQIFQIESFNKHIPTNIPDTLIRSGITADQLPLFDVELDSLMKIYYTHHSEDTVTQLKLAIYKDNIRWWKDITLKPFVRYNMYMNEFNIFKNYGSAGVTLRVPLRFHNKSRLIKAQEMIYQSEQFKELEAGDNELVNIYAEFGFKLKQIKGFYYRKMLNDELIRKELVKKEYHDEAFNPVYTLGLIDDKKAIESEIIDLKKRMYINLVRLAFYLEDRTPTNFITVLKPEDFTGRYDGSVKMFVTKQDLDQFEVNDIANYLWKNEFQDVIFESDSDTISSELSTLVNKTTLGNIFFTVMKKVPDNGQYPDVNTDVNRILEWENTRIIGVHYELELLNNRDSINEVDEVEMSDWLNSIDEQSVNSQIRLSIGVPAGMSINLLNSVFEKFDLVFVHENGVPNSERVEQKYASELNLDAEKLVITLRGTDFADRMHLENYMANLYNNLGVNNFGFSDYRSMNDVDFKTFKKGNEINLQPGELVASVRDQIYQSESEFIKENDPKKYSTTNTYTNQTDHKTKNNFDEKSNIESKNTNTQSVSEYVNETYRIQIAASKVKLSADFLKRFNTNADIREIIVDGYYKYTIGNYQNLNEAKEALRLYHKNSNNNGSFLVTY